MRTLILDLSNINKGCDKVKEEVTEVPVGLQETDPDQIHSLGGVTQARIER